VKMWPVNSQFRIRNSNSLGGPEKGQLGFYWFLSNTVVLLEAARLSNSSRFCVLLGFLRRQIQTIHIRNKPKMIVPKLARRIISFFASSIGISTVVFSVVCSVVVKSVLVASEVEVTSSVWVNRSVDLKKFIFCFWMK